MFGVRERDPLRLAGNEGREMTLRERIDEINETDPEVGAVLLAIYSLLTEARSRIKLLEAEVFDDD